MTRPNEWELPVGAKRFFSEREWQRMRRAYAIAQAVDDLGKRGADPVGTLHEWINNRADELLAKKRP